MVDRDRIRNGLLAVIAGCLVIAALRVSYPVTMPVAVAIIIIAAVWPVKLWLDRALPSPVSYAGTVLLLVIIISSFTTAVYFTLAQVVVALGDNEEQFRRAYTSAISWAQAWGLPDPGGQEGYSRIVSIGRTVLSSTYTVLVYLAFIGLLVVLGLPEVPAFRAKLQEVLGASQRRELIGTADELAGKVREYLGITTLTSLMTGLASGLWAFFVGLDLALVWGVLNFLLNYVPIIGNLAGIVPPSLYAIVQFQNWTMPAIVLAGFVVIQVSISNFVYPMLQGRSLSLSPVAIVLALAFWSWLWGIAGALIAVPLTAAVVIIFERFRSTRWLAHLLSGATGAETHKRRPPP